MGTTSACAENTGFALSPLAVTRNYLRVRGEYRVPRFACVVCDGTTSACAENTIPQDQAIGDEGNYLRVRGEYPHNCYRSTASAELPPRARRILRSTLLTRLSYGTTSACAENTFKEFPQGM